ncbi:MAG: hypothetical protein ACO2Z2_12310 [Paracoccaceae bacterium]
MRIFGLLILVFGLWACSKSSSPDAAQFTTGGFASLKADGTIDVDLTDRTDGIYIDGNGQGFSYVLGLSGPNLVAFAAQGPWQPAVAPPTTGKIRFQTQYAVAAYANVAVIETGGVYNVQGIKKRQNGTLVLDADLLNGTVTGKDENLSVSATISGTDLKGAVSYLGMTGDLQGRISEDVVQGAFSGEMGADVFAGGFRGEAISE